MLPARARLLQGLSLVPEEFVSREWWGYPFPYLTLKIKGLQHDLVQNPAIKELTGKILQTKDLLGPLR